MSVPALRFKEFTSSWTSNKVGDICDFIVPGRNKPKNFDGELPWITTPDIEQSGVINYSKKNLNISKEEAKTVGSKVVPKNSIIISCVGDLGLVAITGRELVINQQLHAFIPKETVYFRFLLFALIIQKPYMEMVATKTAVPYMNKDNCNSIPVVMPSLAEQTKIANFLTAVDEKITQLSQKCELITQYKKGVMQQIFSQKLRFKGDDGQDFPDWEQKRLGDISKFFSGGTPLTTNKSFYNGNIAFIKSGEISAERTAQFITEIGLKGSSAKMVSSGDLLYALYGATSGEVAISRISGAINQAVLCIRSKLNTYYLYSYLRHMKSSILETYLQGGQGNLSAEIIKSLVLPCPNDNEQNKIANFLTAIDDKLTHTQNQLAAAKQYKQGLLQQMFV